MPKLLGWTSWPGFEPRYLHFLCVSLWWLYHFVNLPKKKERFLIAFIVKSLIIPSLRHMHGYQISPQRCTLQHKVEWLLNTLKEVHYKLQHYSLLKNIMPPNMKAHFCQNGNRVNLLCCYGSKPSSKDGFSFLVNKIKSRIMVNQSNWYRTIMYMDQFYF